jgi:VanZ family protein
MSRKVFQIGLVLYIIAILAVSTIPGGKIPDINIWSFDKILHIVEYFILAFLMINALKYPTAKGIIAIIIIGFIYGGFNEIWQGLIAHRYASLYDAIANGVGMIFGSIVTVKYLLIADD